MEIRNSGAREGTEIAQVYLSDLVTSVTWVQKSLLAFGRVTLAPGEAQRLSFSIPYEQLALVDVYERRIVEPGEFEIRVGPSSVDAELLRARFNVEGAPFSFAGIPGRGQGLTGPRAGTGRARRALRDQVRQAGHRQGSNS